MKKKKKGEIIEKKIKAVLPARHRGNNNFYPSNGLLVEDKFLSIFERMTKPPLLSKPQPKPQPFEMIVEIV